MKIDFAAQEREKRFRNNAAVKVYKSNNRIKTKKSARRSSLKSNYGISLEDYWVRLILQSGRCKICNRHRSEFNVALAVDHNHSTGEIRGFLCQQCNTALGLFKDSSELCLKAGEYLK